MKHGFWYKIHDYAITQQKSRLSGIINCNYGKYNPKLQASFSKTLKSAQVGKKSAYKYYLKKCLFICWL